MPRKPVVTRTLTTTKATVLAVDAFNESLVEKTVILPRTYRDAEAIKRAIERLRLLPEPLIVSKVKEFSVETGRYSMPEERFLEHADVIA